MTSVKACLLLLSLISSVFVHANPTILTTTTQHFATLPDNCPTPDAFDIAPDGSLTLSCPNFANKNLEGELFSLNHRGEVSHLVSVPRLKEKNKANPMGIAYGPDGALYVADSRGVKQGRILKLSFDGRKLINTEVIATGLNPNGLRYFKGALYATQLTMPKVKSTNNTSGIYRIDVNARNLQLSNTLADPQLIFSVETQNPQKQIGLDGLAFDSKGHLYTANMGDGIVYKLTLDDAGQVTTTEDYAKVPWQASVDGMTFDQYDNMYLAGFASNQLFKIDSQQNVTVLADYPDNDGTNGQLDQPADLLVYGDKLIISNFDLMVGNGMENTQHGKPYTLSYFPLTAVE